MEQGSNFLKANKLLQIGEYKKAIHIYQQLISRYPTFKYYSKNAGYASDKLGLAFDSALFYMQSYLADRSDSASLLAASRLKKSSNKDDLVLILIPAFNSEMTIIESVNSVLAQEHTNIHVVVIDDASTDRTYELVSNLKKKDDRLFVIRNAKNNGAYYSVNIGLFLFRWLGFDYFIKHDADDIMLSNKIKDKVIAIKSNKQKYFCTSGYERIDFNNKKKLSMKKRGHSMTLYKSDVFLKIGYYDINRFGCDSEYLERAIAAYGPEAELHLSEVLTYAYFLETGLTANNPLGSRSRMYYQEKFRCDIETMSKLKFFYKKFDLHEELLKILRSAKFKVCGVATLYSRREALRDVVTAILPQVDKLVVYQNDYKEIFDYLKHEKIEVISALDTGIDMGDAGKFFKVNDFGDVNYFSIDDDLVYPPNYVDVFLDLLFRHDNSIIVTAHGRISRPSINSYYKDVIKVFHFNEENQKLHPVHFGGTGVMAFNTKKVDINFEYFKHENMADVWMGLYSRKNKIPILVAPHFSGWICQNGNFDIETTIYRKVRKKDSNFQKTEHFANNILDGLDFGLINTVDIDSGVTKEGLVVNGNSIKCKVSDRFKIAVAIPTFNRKDLLTRLVNQLDLAAKCFHVHLVIFDDGSEVPVDSSFFTLKNISEIKITRCHNHGKKRYWLLVNMIFDYLSSVNSDYNFYLGDDLEVGPSFFIDAINQWESIEDEAKISLNLLRDARTKSWTNFARVERNFSGFSVFQTQWLDMIMMFSHKLLSYRLNEVSLSRWHTNPLLSSGVGAQLSSRFNQLGYTMYQVKESLVEHGDHASEMNPEERVLNPLVSV